MNTEDPVCEKMYILVTDVHMYAAWSKCADETTYL